MTKINVLAETGLPGDPVTNLNVFSRVQGPGQAFLDRAYLDRMASINARFRRENPPFPQILGERPQKLCCGHIINTRVAATVIAVDYLLPRCSPPSVILIEK